MLEREGEELQREVNEEGESDEDADGCSDCVDGGATATWRSVSQRTCVVGVTPCGAFCHLSTLSACCQWTVHSAAEREGE